MTDPYRLAGEPSPFEAGAHVTVPLRPEIAFDPVAAGVPELQDAFASIDTIDLGEQAPGWLVSAAKLIRPLSVGALMAIPTVGAGSVGLVAMIAPARGEAMARASVLFLQGLPLDVVVLIGTLATGYGFARSVEKLKRKG